MRRVYYTMAVVALLGAGAVLAVFVLHRPGPKAVPRLHPPDPCVVLQSAEQYSVRVGYGSAEGSRDYRYRLELSRTGESWCDAYELEARSERRKKFKLPREAFEWVREQLIAAKFFELRSPKVPGGEYSVADGKVEVGRVTHSVVFYNQQPQRAVIMTVLEYVRRLAERAEPKWDEQRG
jgi:hypothetical protein